MNRAPLAPRPRRRAKPLAAAGLAAALGFAALLGGCVSRAAPAAAADPAEIDRQALAAIQNSFRGQGIAGVDRIRQDLGQSACSSPTPPAEPVAERVMAEARATVKWPAGGRYIGNWREGERIAQSGRGLTWTDAPASEAGPNGGSCYNCHQIDRAEISHGTIGPSLWNYGKNRGVRELYAATSQPIIEYTWMKLYNSKSYNACSNMPRFGHLGILDQQQLAHLMALLLDPASPVNQ